VTEHMDALAAEFLERYGREPTQVELRRAVVRSRRRKTVTAKTGLRHYCRGVAALHDITPASLAELRRTGRPRTDAQARALVAAELLGPDGLTSEQATFRGSDLRVAAFRHGAGLLDVGQVEQLVLDLQRSGELRAPVRTGGRRAACGSLSTAFSPGTRSGPQTRWRTVNSRRQRSTSSSARSRRATVARTCG